MHISEDVITSQERASGLLQLAELRKAARIGPGLVWLAMGIGCVWMAWILIGGPNSNSIWAAITCVIGTAQIAMSFMLLSNASMTRGLLKGEAGRLDRKLVEGRIEVIEMQAAAVWSIDLGDEDSLGLLVAESAEAMVAISVADDIVGEGGRMGRLKGSLLRIRLLPGERDIVSLSAEGDQGPPVLEGPAGEPSGAFDGLESWMRVKVIRVDELSEAWSAAVREEFARLEHA